MLDTSSVNPHHQIRLSSLVMQCTPSWLLALHVASYGFNDWSKRPFLQPVHVAGAQERLLSNQADQYGKRTFLNQDRLTLCNCTLGSEDCCCMHRYCCQYYKDSEDSFSCCTSASTAEVSPIDLAMQQVLEVLLACKRHLWHAWLYYHMQYDTQWQSRWRNPSENLLKLVILFTGCRML